MCFVLIVLFLIGVLLIVISLMITQKDLRKMNNNNKDILEQYKQMQDAGMF